MALFTRFSRLIKADLHAVLDNLELPDVQLRQALRDMEAAHEQQQLHCQTLTSNLQRLNTALSRIDADLAELTRQLDWCFADAASVATADQPHSLIRTLLRRRLVAEQRRKQLLMQQTQQQQLHQHAEQIQQQQAQRLDELRQQATLLAIHLPDAAQPDTSGEHTISDADVDLALLRERQTRSPQ